MASSNSRSCLPIAGVVLLGGVLVLTCYRYIAPQLREAENQANQAKRLADDKQRMEALTQPLREARTVFEGLTDEASVQKAEPRLNQLYQKLLDLKSQPNSVQATEHLTEIDAEADSLALGCLRVEQKIPTAQGLARKWVELAESFATEALDHMKQTDPASYKLQEELAKHPLGLFGPNGGEEDAAEARRHFEKAGGFSFVPPEEWEVKDVPGEQFKVVVAKDLRKSQITVQAFPADGDLKSFVSDVKKVAIAQLKASRVRKEEDFATTSGLKGVRLRVEYTADDQDDLVSCMDMYFFGTPEVKYVIKCRDWDSERGGDDKFDPTYERAMETFRFEKQ